MILTKQMFERASRKLGLDHAVLASMTDTNETNFKMKPKAKEIDALLRHGAYGFFKDDEDDASRTFKEADIEKVSWPIAGLGFGFLVWFGFFFFAVSLSFCISVTP
jgi:hypothetical protein